MLEDDVCVVRTCDNSLFSSVILDLKSIMFKLRDGKEVSHAMWHDPYVKQVFQPTFMIGVGGASMTMPPQAILHDFNVGEFVFDDTLMICQAVVKEQLVGVESLAWCRYCLMVLG